MGWLDKLKTLVEASLNVSNISLININYTKNSNNTETTHSITENNPFFYDGKNQKLYIDLKQLQNHPKLYKQVKELLQESIKEGNYLLENESSDLLDRLYSYNKSDSNYKKYLQVFDGIIPKEDYKALESSFFLRSILEKEKEVNVEKYKRGIIRQFGQRGGHIANLCTAGYFEELLIPIFNDYSKEDFQNYYQLVVEYKALTLFVHSRMKKKDIISSLKNKMGIAKQYGLENFYVHAKGKKNIKTVETCLSGFEEIYGAIPKVEMRYNNSEILVVKIILKG